MGGRPGGGEAAQAAVAGVLTSLATSGIRRHTLIEAVTMGNQAVRQLRMSAPTFAEEATTLTVVVLLETPGLDVPQCVAVHVGDSPAFLARGDELTLLTRL